MRLFEQLQAFAQHAKRVTVMYADIELSGQEGLLQDFVHRTVEGGKGMYPW